MRIKTRKNIKTSNEWKFTNQNWKRALKEITNYAPNRYGRGKSNYGEDHPLIKRLKIAPYELMLIMSFLAEQGLIEYDQQEHNWINLTSKGFEVSLQNQNQELAYRTNLAMGILMAIIAFAAITSLINAGLTWEARVGLITLIVGLGYILWRAKKRGI